MTHKRGRGLSGGVARVGRGLHSLQFQSESESGGFIRDAGVKGEGVRVLRAHAAVRDRRVRRGRAGGAEVSRRRVHARGRGRGHREMLGDRTVSDVITLPSELSLIRGFDPPRVKSLFTKKRESLN